MKCGDSWLLWLTGLEHAEGGVGDGRAEWTFYHCVDAIELPSVQLNQAVSLAKALVRGEPTAGAFRMMYPDTVLEIVRSEGVTGGSYEYPWHRAGIGRLLRIGLAQACVAVTFLALG